MRRRLFEVQFKTTCAGCRKQIRKRKPAHMVDGLTFRARLYVRKNPDKTGGRRRKCGPG